MCIGRGDSTDFTDSIIDYQLFTTFRLCLTVKLIYRCRFGKVKNHQYIFNVPLSPTDAPIIDKCWTLSHDSVISSSLALQSSFDFGFKG